jgi:hypothetical protein
MRNHLVEVANAKRWQSISGTYYTFPTKRLTSGVGSNTIEFIDGSREWVPALSIDEQSRYVTT